MSIGSYGLHNLPGAEQQSAQDPEDKIAALETEAKLPTTQEIKGLL